MDRFGSEGEFCALIGDVVASRRSAARRRLQGRLLTEVDALNGLLSTDLATPLALTAGDEVQGLLIRPERAVAIVVRLSEAIFPERLVFGLGYGGLSTEIYDDVARIDGPCFHRARAALDEGKGDVWLIAQGFGAPTDRVLTTLFILMGAIRNRWTEKQATYVREARLKPQKDVAAELGVSRSTVSESLTAASFAAVQEGEETATLILEEFGFRDESTKSSVREPK